MSETLFPIAVFHWNAENGKKLRELRDAAGYGREFLSEMADTSISYIQALEDPSLVAVRKTKIGTLYQITVGSEKLLAIAKVLDVPIHSFFSKEERVSVLIAFGVMD